MTTCSKLPFLVMAIYFLGLATLCPPIRAQGGQETQPLVNVALASSGAEIDASSYNGGDVPDRLIDGIVDNSLSHRWHSDTTRQFPHWLQLKFPKPLPLRRIIFHAAALDCFPTKISIGLQGTDGKITPLLDTTLTPALVVTVDLPPVTTDNLSITILDSNAAMKGYTQLSMLEVLAAITPEEAKALGPLALANDEGPAGEKNVALAREGGVAAVSSTGIFGRNHPDYGPSDVLAGPGQLNDGRYVLPEAKVAVGPGAPQGSPANPGPKSPVCGNRWISQVDQPNPHWAWIRFKGKKRIDGVILRCSMLRNYPTDFRGEYSEDGGLTFKTIFAMTNQKPSKRTLKMEYHFQPVTTDNFRLMITKSVATSPAEENTQLSEIEVYGQDADAASSAKAAPEPTTPAEMPGTLLTPQEDKNVTIEDRAEEVEFRSVWQRIVFSKTMPRITNLCWDSMGKGEFGVNLLMKNEGIGPRVDRPTYEPIVPKATLRRDGNVIRYGPFMAASGVSMVWEIRVTEKKVEMALATNATQPLIIRPGLIRFAFDDGQTLTSPFYNPKRLGYATLPVILNAADFGTALFQSDDMAGFHVRAAEYASSQVFADCDLTPNLPTRGDGLVEWPSGDWTGHVSWEVNQITPMPGLVKDEPRLQNLPRYVLNGLQYRPDQDMLCNSMVSINCPFCMWENAETAQWLPILPGGIDPCQLLRTSMDNYIRGTPGHTSTEWSIYSPHYSATGDTPASFIYAMWTYVLKTGDKEQLQRWMPALDRILEMLATANVKHDGLLYTTGPYVRGVGWFDTMAIHGLDAGLNIFSYRAYQDAADLYRMAGQDDKAANCDQRAAAIKKAFVPALLDPKTGVIAGGIMEDGTVVDPWYVWLNGMAIDYGLVPDDLANQILDKFQAKFKEVGYTRFENGLPNTLEPVPCPPQIKKTDGSPWNPFQNYLNGGACAAWSNFYIQALYQMGRRHEADAIYWPLVDSYGKGRFNGGSANRRDNANPDEGEWWYWDGRPQHAEGYLIDMYQPVTVLWTGHFGFTFGAHGYRIAPWSPLKNRSVPLGLTFMGKTVDEAR